MGREAIAKGASVLLGPTVNIQRSPLGGRGFESYSEDPVLSGNMAAAAINGIQSTGVAATLKHFVCNDLEDRRMASNSLLTERALREIYLLPFQIAQRDARPAAIMTSYNLVNGEHVSENRRLLQQVLRDEWGFDGCIMSDWFGVYSTTESLKAGLDLEMPGPTLVRGRQIDLALRCGKLLPHHIDARVREVLKLIKHVLPLGIPERAPERTVDSPETAALLREITASSIVLLKNDRAVLPFDKQKTIAVIGPNAAYAAYCGGGSASLPPYYAVPPLQGVQSKTTKVEYALGAPGWKKLPLLSYISKSLDGQPGFSLKIYKEPPTEKSRTLVDDLHVRDSNINMFDYRNPHLRSSLFYADIDCVFTPEESTEYEFSCSVAGTAKLFVDDQLVVDNATKQHPGESFFGAGTREELGVIALTAGRTYKVHVAFGSMQTMTLRKGRVSAFGGAGGIRLGCYRKIDPDTEIQRAVALAKKCDQVLLCAGLNSDWESEGFDRRTMALPPRNDDLIAAVLAANPRTAVVIQSGTPVSMPWQSSAPAILQAWYGGNETGNGLADVVFGDVTPSGKLSLSYPAAERDNPAFLNYRSHDNRVLYGEDVFVGYRFYEKMGRPPLFAFGHGESYTTFALRDFVVQDYGDDRESVTVTATIANTGGKYAGRAVLQIYIAPPINSTVPRPIKELRGFAKSPLLAPGAEAKVEVILDKKAAASYWNEGRDAWIAEAGNYRVLAAFSSSKVEAEGELRVRREVVWRGVGGEGNGVVGADGRAAKREAKL